MKYYFGPKELRSVTLHFTWWQDIYYSVEWFAAWGWYELINLPGTIGQAYKEWKRKRTLARILKDPEMRELQRLAGIKK